MSRRQSRGRLQTRSASICSLGSQSQEPCCISVLMPWMRSLRPLFVKLLTALAVLQRRPNVGLLLASRDHVKLGQLSRVRSVPVLASDDDVRLHLEIKIDEAVGSVLHEEAGGQDLGENEQRRRAKKGFRDELINSIVAKCKGMFLLADLQIRQLETAVSIRELCELLATQPEELDGQYAVYIRRVLSRRHREMAVSILTWIYASKSQLEKDELLEALSVRAGDTNRDKTGIPSSETVVKVSEGLVIYDANSCIFRLAHETLRTYLDTHSEEVLGNPHRSILETLSTYLQFCSFNNMESSSANTTPNDVMDTLTLFALISCCVTRFSHGAITLIWRRLSPSPRSALELGPASPPG